MENRVIREYLALNKTLPFKKHQILLEGDIIVPDVKPDIRNVLEYDYDVVVDQVDLVNEKCFFKGALEIKVLYVAKGSEYIHSMVNRLNIDDYLAIPEVFDNTYYDVKCEIGNIDFKMVNDRKLSYRAVIDVTGKGYERGEYEFVKDIEDLNHSNILYKDVRLMKNVGLSRDKFLVKDQAHLPQNSENIFEIVQMKNRICNRDIKCLDGEVHVSGELLSTIYYRQDKDGCVLECIEHTTQFNGAINLKESQEGVGMSADVEMYICDSKVVVGVDSDGEDRCFDLEAEILVKVKCVKEDVINIVEDAHCVNKKAVFNKVNVETTNIVTKNKNQCNIKEVVGINTDNEEVLQIVSVNPKVFVNRVVIDDGKVIVGGVVELSTVYIAKTDVNPICSSKSKLLFEQVVEAKGSLPHMICDVDTFVENISFNMINEKEIEVRVNLNINVSVNENKPVNLIYDLEFENLDPDVLNSIASVTIHVVQQGETLWGIAKEYNTNVDDIARVNGIENIDYIQVGQKLLIIKKVEM